MTRRRSDEVEPSDEMTARSWQLMLARVAEQERAHELAQRLRRTEMALERLNLD